MLSKHSPACCRPAAADQPRPCLYDERLLQQETLLLDSGQPGCCWGSARDFKSILLAKASAARFREPLTASARTSTVRTTTAPRSPRRCRLHRPAHPAAPGRTIEIPPLPETAQKIIAARRPGRHGDDITGVVETDPALAAQVVSWAAGFRPYYAGARQDPLGGGRHRARAGLRPGDQPGLGLALGKTLSLPEDHRSRPRPTGSRRSTPPPSSRA